MFQAIRSRLLALYVLSFLVCMAGFAIAFRILFVHSLNQRADEQLRLLAVGASRSIESDGKGLHISMEFPLNSYLTKEQGLEWFDRSGQRLFSKGRVFVRLPVPTSNTIQNQDANPPIRAITLPLHDSETRQTIGRLRASQSMEEHYESIARLDIALALSIGVGAGFGVLAGFLMTRKAMVPIETSFLRMKQFVGDASHELRSPIMAISSNAQVALRYPAGMRAGDQEKFKTIAATAQQMKELTEHLFQLTQAEDQPPQGVGPLALGTLLRDQVERFLPRAQQHAIDLQLLLPQQASLQVNGSGRDLGLLFSNLIENALTYTPDGGRVQITADADHHTVRVMVEDNGIGIAQDQIPFLFDRFWRADAARQNNTGGYGLGLSIVQAILLKYKGSIQVTSLPGQGSCFEVRLPALSESSPMGELNPGA
jgi:two-component system, OmpR family, manganese sensing sensor histidine kinase